MSVKITREEYRRIKQMNREEMERFISRCLQTEPEEKEQIRKEALLDARIALEKAISIKGIGGVRRAEIREKYKEALEERNETEL